ncbi:hypothetical protein HAX54_011230 [Datura stramonium]|uniref:Uncharacterized protein n=1 Tax=Datura stramonium TaxID=4076 RepID=A0ABS8Y3C1_DATST|nr:hypothetical protein [Datura stramonium]
MIEDAKSEEDPAKVEVKAGKKLKLDLSPVASSRVGSAATPSQVSPSIGSDRGNLLSSQSPEHNAQNFQIGFSLGKNKVFRSDGRFAFDVKVNGPLSG